MRAIPVSAPNRVNGACALSSFNMILGTTPSGFVLLIPAMQLPIAFQLFVGIEVFPMIANQYTVQVIYLVQCHSRPEA